MREEQIIAQLEAAWESGFFALAGQGRYDSGKAAALLDLLASIKLGGVTTLNRRLVALLWYMPPYLEDQTRLVQEKRGDLIAYKRTSAQVMELLEEILGTP